MSTIVLLIAIACLAWSCFVYLMTTLGILRLYRSFTSRPKPAVSPTLDRNQNHVPHVAAIRPVKGLEPHLYECVASTCRQAYPQDKLAIYLCVANKADPAYPVLEKIVKDFPQCDVKLFVEEEDPLLHGPHGDVHNLGPNPKIRNISRAYREAEGDLIWIVDSNVWVGPGATGHMVDRLLGLRSAGSGDSEGSLEQRKPCKFVHQLPIVVDTFNPRQSSIADGEALLSLASEARSSAELVAPETRTSYSMASRIWDNGGGRLDEMFMATTHAKFYCAINTVGIAPCVVGKSNMFRKSHLEMLTDQDQNPDLPKDRNHPTGVDYFSYYICEDHLIGDLLFKAKIPGFAHHGLVDGELAVQPMSGFSVEAYAARRARWLRARKWTVITATLVEPGVESLLCCLYFSFAITTLPWFHQTFNVPQTWKAMFLSWLLTVTIWMTTDYFFFLMVHSGKSIHVDHNTPFFARGMSTPSGVTKRSFLEWLPAWIVRESLALPIWTWAVLMGATVNWRGKNFLVRMDMSVVELETQKRRRSSGGLTPELELGRAGSKNRTD